MTWRNQVAEDVRSTLAEWTEDEGDSGWNLDDLAKAIAECIPSPDLRAALPAARAGGGERDKIMMARGAEIGYGDGFAAGIEAKEQQIESQVEHRRDDTVPFNSGWNACLAAIRALSPPTSAGAEWQPIETAPKHEELLLAWSSGKSIEVGGYYGEGWVVGDGEDYSSTPTHWRHLPELPTAGITGASSAVVSVGASEDASSPQSVPTFSPPASAETAISPEISRVYDAAYENGKRDGRLSASAQAESYMRPCSLQDRPHQGVVGLESPPGALPSASAPAGAKSRDHGVTAQECAHLLRAWAKAYRDMPEHRFPSDPNAEFFPQDLERAALELERAPAGAPSEEEAIRAVMNSLGWSGTWSDAQIAARTLLALLRGS